jgi:glutathione S-transferase
MLKLYQFPASGNSRIVRIVLSEKKLEYERVNIAIGRGDNREPEFLRLNPRGKVPILVHREGDREAVVYESTIINEYLEDAFTAVALMPKDPAGRARVRLFTNLFDTAMSPTAGPLIIESLLRTDETRRQNVVDKGRAATRKILLELAALMGDGDYLAGEYSLADPSFTPAVDVLGACGISIEAEFPSIWQWLMRVRARPSFVESA